MLGDFLCNIPQSPKTSFQPTMNFGSCSKLNLNLSNQSQVSAKLVFGCLKSHLVNSALGQQQTVQSNDDASSGKSIAVNSVYFKRCLGWGHRVRDYTTGAIHCWFYSHYGHVQRSCFRWKSIVKSKWIQKKNVIVSATATLEPHTEAIGKTQGAHLDEVIPPVLSLNTSQLGVGKSTTPIDTFPASATTLSTVTHSSASQQSPSMVNFTMDPLPYTPPSLFLEDGGPHSHNRRWVFVS
jgi:hypothetical protein